MPNKEYIDIGCALSFQNKCYVQDLTALEITNKSDPLRMYCFWTCALNAYMCSICLFVQFCLVSLVQVGQTETQRERERERRGREGEGERNRERQKLGEMGEKQQETEGVRK